MMKGYRFLITLAFVFAGFGAFAQPELVITEIMYNPPEGGTDSLEYVEIYNNGDTTADITGYSFIGVTFTFPQATLAPGAYAVVAVNPSAIANNYGYTAAYQYTGGLSNNGEVVALYDSFGALVDSVNFDDVAPWPFGFAAGEPDGGGASLTLCDPNSDNNVGTSWISSTNSTGITINTNILLGSPGAADSACVCIPVTNNIPATSCGSYTSPSGMYTWNATGVYEDTLTNVGGCDSVLIIHLTIAAPTTATLNMSSCGSVTSPSGNYVWAASGMYMDTIPNFVGCDSVITVQLTVNAPSSSTANVSACDQYVSPSGQVYSTTGTFTELLTNAAGCDSTVTYNVTIETLSNTVTLSAGTITAAASGVNYQWIDCNSGQHIAGATGQSFTPQTNGSYAVILTGTLCSDTSACTTITGLGMEPNLLENAVSIAPNPTDGIITVHYTGAGVAEVIVYGLDGKQMTTSSVVSGNEMKLELTGASGLYFVKVVANERQANFRVIKK